MKILVVEDDPMTADLIREFLLSRYPDADVDLAFNGKDGLEQARKSKYDIIITNINMPVMNGIDFLRNLRDFPDYREVPKIVLSGNATRKVFIEAYRLGACYCMYKPFDFYEFLAVVNEAMEVFNNHDQDA